MTNKEQKHLAAERYPELSAADARKALRQDLAAEREHDNVIRLYQQYQEQRRKDAEHVAQVERDLDMSGIAQKPRRTYPRRRLNPGVLMAALMIGTLGGSEK